MKKNNLKNINWNSIYKKLSNRKKSLLTNEFLNTFRDELIKIFNQDNSFSEKQLNYWEFFQVFEDTSGFATALKITCEKYNLKTAIWQYYCKMNWYDSDVFTGDLTILMKDRGVIPEGSIDDYCTCDDIYCNEDNTIHYIISHKHKGYNTLEKDWCYIEDFESMKESYAEITNIDILCP